MKKTKTILGIAGVAFVVTGCISDPTHMKACAKPSPVGVVAMEPDACDKQDDDYDRNARAFYVPNDGRFERWNDLGVGDLVPQGIGSFARPSGETRISDVLDD